MLRSLWSLLLLALLWAAPASAETDFLPPDQAFRLSVDELDSGETRLRWGISDGYYLYRKSIKVEALSEGGQQAVELPDGTIKEDPYFGKSEVYYQQLVLTLPASGARQLRVSWQGCAEAGLCYPPVSRVVTLSGHAAVAEDAAAPAEAAQAGQALGEDQVIVEQLTQANVGWLLVLFFGIGVLMTFTPCVLPMLPIVSSLVVGSGATPRRGLVLSLAFVLPMALTYAALGATAAAMGANLQALLQTPWALGGFALLFVLLALAMFDVYQLQLPAFLRNRLNDVSQRQRGGSLGGAAAMGVLSALLVGPCMTAPLAGVLLYISNSGDVLKGSLALLAMGLGMGVPLLIVGTFGTKLLPRPGVWMNRIKYAFGFMMLGMAIWFIERVLPPSVSLALWGAWLLSVAIGLLALSKALAAPQAQWGVRCLVAPLAVWAVAMLLGAAAGETRPLQPLAFVAMSEAGDTRRTPDFLARFIDVTDANTLQSEIDAATGQGQWVLVDYYADWCVACKEIEHQVLGDVRVQQALADFKLIRPDVTDDNAQSARMMTDHQVLGPPSLLFIGPDGKERRASRIVGTLSPEAFLEKLEQAQQSS